MASNGAVFGTVVSVSSFDPVVAVRQDRGAWLAMGVDANGLVFGSFPIFYTGDGCTGDAYAYIGTSPMPMFRGLQRMLPTDTLAFYAAGNSPQTRSFPSMVQPDQANPNQKKCYSTTDPAVPGWTGDLLVGPMQTIDLTQFPAPLHVQ